MRDLGSRWPAIPDWATASLKTATLELRSLADLDQHLVSGDLAACRRYLRLDDEGVGALGLAAGLFYALRLARDRILLVGRPSAELAPGWHEEGFAVTEVSAALHVFEIGGTDTDALLSRATTLDLRQPGRSAAVSFAGIRAVLYRHGRPDRVRLHVDRTFAPFIWNWVETCIGEQRAKAFPTSPIAGEVEPGA